MAVTEVGTEAITHYNSATASCALPTGWAAGQLAIICHVHRSSGTTYTTEPSGWTLISKRESSPIVNTSGAFYRVLQAGDTAPTWTMSQSNPGTTIVVTYTGFDTTTPIGDIVAATLEGTASTTHTIPTYSTTVDGSRAIVVTAGYSGTNYTAPSPWTLEATAASSSGGARSVGAFGQDKTPAGSVGGQTFTTGANSRNSYHPFAIRPAATAAATSLLWPTENAQTVLMRR